MAAIIGAADVDADGAGFDSMGAITFRSECGAM
jgi:hypothetical protein